MKTQTEEIIIELPFALPSLNDWMDWHYHKRKDFRNTLAWEIRATYGRVKHKPIQLSEVTVTRYGVKELDWVNLYGSFKSCEDTLIVSSKRNPSGLGIIQDDSPKHVKALTITQKVVKQGEQRTIISIQPLDG